MTALNPEEEKNTDKATEEGVADNDNDKDEKITLKVKTTSSDKFDICLSTKSTVLQLKEAIKEASSDKIDTSLQRLIYKGKVLKDELKICEPPYNMKDQHTVILVKSRVKRAAPSNAPSNSNSNDNNAQAQSSSNANNNNNNAPPPNNNNNNNNANNANPMGNLFGMLGNMQGMGGVGGMGGMGNAMGMDPNMMMQMMNNPMFQQMTDQLLQNPQMLQQVMEYSLI